MGYSCGFKIVQPKSGDVTDRYIYIYNIYIYTIYIYNIYINTIIYTNWLIYIYWDLDIVMSHVFFMGSYMI